MLRRLAALGSAAAVMAMAILFVTAPPAAATPSDGIESVVPAYVFEDDPLLAALCDPDDTPVPPAYVIINIGNGQTDQVAELDEDAQCLQGRGTLVLGYVTACASNCGTLLPTLRTDTDVATDMSRYVNPFSSYPTLKADRHNGNRMVDGFFIDEAPRDCGPQQTPTNNPADDQDYVYRFSQYAAAANSLFTTWFSDDPVIVANAGTAIRGCYIGYKAYGPMPDIFGTAENTGSNYLAGWAGGNIITGGVTGTTYEDGNNLCADCFWHLTHQVGTAADTEAVIDLADARGASGITVTDDGADSNPWDEIPGTSGGPALQLLGAPIYSQFMAPGSVRLDYTNDILDISGGGVSGAVLRESYEPNCDNPGTPLVVERCVRPSDGIELMYAAIDAKCGPSGTVATGSWGTSGQPFDTSYPFTTDPNQTMIDCAQTVMLNETGRDMQALVCAHAFSPPIRRWTDEDPDRDEADCQDEDGTMGYVYSPTTVTALGDGFFSTDDRTRKTLWGLREWENRGGQATYGEDSGYPYRAACFIGRDDWQYPKVAASCPS